MPKANVLSFLKNNPKFSLLWLSQIFSQITLNMINFVMAARIYEKTHSALAVSFLWIFYFLPALFIGPFSGFFVDLWDRRKVLLVTNILEGLTILCYLFISDSIYPIYSIVFIYSIQNQFYFPAEAATIPSVVRKDDLPLANSLFMFTAQSALAIGFGLGGVFLRLFGKYFPIIFTSICLFMGAIAVYFLPSNKSPKKFNLDDISSFLAEIKTGYVYIKNKPAVFFPIIILVFFQVLITVIGVSLPSFAAYLGIPISDAGPALVFPLGIGALIGAILVSNLSATKRKKDLMSSGMLIIVLTLAFFSLIVPFFGHHRLVPAIPLMVLLGIGALLVYVPNQTLIQANTPEELRGRIFGTLGFLATLVTLPFLLFSATITEVLGLKMMFLWISGFLFIAFLFIYHGEANMFYKSRLLLHKLKPKK